MKMLPRDITATKGEIICAVIDHLVDALGGEPGCTVRRAVILTDIDQYPGTTQSEIMERLGVHKSTLNRDIEWLYDYGCILKSANDQDARAIQLRICGYAKKNLDFALEYFDNSHKSLKNFLIRLINLCGAYKPTLRDAKIMAVVGEQNNASKQQIFRNLYNGPATTDNRAVRHLLDIGVLERSDERI